MKIIPAILRQNLLEIEKDLQGLNLDGNQVCDLISLDLCDGFFVSTTTWLPSHEDSIQETHSPLHGASIEFDLMVRESDILKYLNLGLKLGVRKFVIHSENREIIIGSIDFIKSHNLEIGLCCDDMNILKEFAQQIDYIQIMGIKNLGFQHEEFQLETLEKIKKVREFYPRTIQIDGGLNVENIKKCQIAGANNFILGSTIFTKGNPGENYLKILEELISPTPGPSQ